jgi:lysophospholipase L1-like esterase
VRIRVAALLALMLATGWFGALSSPPARAAGPVTWAIVGDSIIGGNVTTIQSVLTRSDLPPWHIDGRSARRMVTPVVTSRWSASSGLDAIRATRALGHDPKRWVIELGTNDAGSVTNCSCADQIAFADSLIRQLVDEIGSGSQILWVNVRGSTSGVLAINAALAARASASPSTFQVADWNGYTAGRDAWFIDGVHPTTTGAIELGKFLVAAVRALPPVPGSSASSTASSTAQLQTGLTPRLRPLCRDPERTFRLCHDTET